MSAVGQFSVRWVYNKPVGHREGGQRPALCFRGRKYAFCVITGHPVRVVKRDAALFDKYREVTFSVQGTVETGKGEGAKRYPVAHAVEKMREIATRNGITAAASQLLDRALENRVDVDEDSINDEEEITTMSTSETEVKAAVAKTAKKAGGAKKAPKPAKQAKAKKAKGNGAAKSHDPLGKPGSLTRFMNERLVKGQDNDTISAAAKKAFPKSKSTKPTHVSWFRWKAGELGLIKPSKK